GSGSGRSKPPSAAGMRLLPTVPGAFLRELVVGDADARRLNVEVDHTRVVATEDEGLVVARQRLEAIARERLAAELEGHEALEHRLAVDEHAAVGVEDLLRAAPHDQLGHDLLEELR